MSKLIFSGAAVVKQISFCFASKIHQYSCHDVFLLPPSPALLQAGSEMQRTRCCAAQKAFGSVVNESPALFQCSFTSDGQLFRRRDPCWVLQSPQLRGWALWWPLGAAGAVAVQHLAGSQSHAVFPKLWSVVGCVDRKKKWINPKYISMCSMWAAWRGSVPGCLSQLSSPGWVSVTWSFLCRLGSWKRERACKLNSNKMSWDTLTESAWSFSSLIQI